MSLVAELEHLPSDKRLWVAGAAIAAFVLLQGRKGGGGEAAGGGISPQDLLGIIRSTQQSTTGSATAGVAAGGAIAQSGIESGTRVAEGALALAGRDLDVLGRTAQDATSTLGRSLESTLRVLGDLARGTRYVFGRAGGDDGISPLPPPARPFPQPVSPIAAAPAPVGEDRRDHPPTLVTSAPTFAQVERTAAAGEFRDIPAGAKVEVVAIGGTATPISLSDYAVAHGLVLPGAVA